MRVAESAAPAGRGAGRPAASMEPQLEGCGKMAPARTPPRPEPLQWSRNLRVAESLRRTTICPPLDRCSDHMLALASACRAFAFSRGGAISGIISRRRAPQGPNPLTGPLAHPRRRRPRSHHTTNDGLLPPPCCSRTPIVSMRPSEPSPYEGPTSTTSTLSWA